MRVFVAGARGAIGTRLVPQLVERGHEVIGTTRSEEKARRLDASGRRSTSVGSPFATAGSAARPTTPRSRPSKSGGSRSSAAATASRHSSISRTPRRQPFSHREGQARDLQRGRRRSCTRARVAACARVHDRCEAAAARPALARPSPRGQWGGRDHDRGASNAKAKRELGWRLRYPNWRQGFAASYRSVNGLR
jgi:NAD dependent epimerase/dehydratase family